MSDVDDAARLLLTIGRRFGVLEARARVRPALVDELLAEARADVDDALGELPEFRRLALAELERIRGTLLPAVDLEPVDVVLELEAR